MCISKKHVSFQNSANNAFLCSSCAIHYIQGDIGPVVKLSIQYSMRLTNDLLCTAMTMHTSKALRV